MSASPPYRVPRRKTGRCANGAERDRGTVFHAVPRDSGWAKAMCGTEPGRLSAGWSNEIGDDVTCERCKSRMGRRRCVECRTHFDQHGRCPNPYCGTRRDDRRGP